MQTLYSIYWNYRVFIYCHFWSRNMNAFVDINMFIIGILVTHYLFKAANKINKFSKKGKLPRESQQKYFQCFYIGLIVTSVLLLATFIALNFYLTNHLDHSGSAINKLDFYWGIIRAVGLILNIMQLVCTIYKLKTANVQATNSGHLNLRDATILLIFMILMTGTGLASAITSDMKKQTLIDMFRDIIDYTLAIMYFKMITKFIASFRLQTTVDNEGKVQIVAIEPNGIEVFRFTLEGEQYTNLLGIATTVLDVRKYGKKKKVGKA